MRQMKEVDAMKMKWAQGAGRPPRITCITTGTSRKYEMLPY